MTLEELCKAHTEVRKDGFSIHLDDAQTEWNSAIHAAGRKPAYRAMANYLSKLYREQYGREFLFSERCMAFEIQFHADAYLAMTVGGYPRHIATLPFSRKSLISHCRVIDISEDDVKSVKQRFMFGYRRGVREQLRGTERDPFRR